MTSPFLEPGHVAWVRASVADVRAQPAHGAEQVTQALQGEVGIPQREQDGWLQVRLADGYVGWVREWHLVAVSEDAVQAFRSRCTARINVAWTAVRGAPRGTAAPVAETLLGTHVIPMGTTEGDWVEVELPTGLQGWVQQSQLVQSGADWEPEVSSIRAMLQEFLGVPYVWGGKSPKGFDCSGLVQFVYGLHGISLPRDSSQQFAATPRVDGTPAAGDLLFFADPVSHVAVQFDAQRYLHARGCVRFNSLDPQHPLYEASLAAQFRGATRVLPHSVRPGSAT